MSLTKNTYSMLNNAPINVKDFGAVGDGVTDDTTAINNAKNSIGTNGTLLIPVGSYLYSGTVYPVGTNYLYSTNNFNTSVAIMTAARAQNMLLTTETPNVSGTVDPQHSRVALSVTAKAMGAQHADGIRSNLTNYSTDGNGNTAFYGHAVSAGTTTNWSAAIHGETRHGGGTSIGIDSENQSYESTGTIHGIVVNNTTANGTTHPVTGASPVDCINAYALNITGGNTSGTGIGGWEKAIYVRTGAMREGGICIHLTPTAIVSSHIQTNNTSKASVADILLQGNSHNGIVCNGTYEMAAIRIATGNYLSLNTAGTHKILVGTGSPEGVVGAIPGSLYMNTSGGAGTTLYVKQSGNAMTGWVGK